MMTARPDNAEFNPPPSFWDLLVAVHIVFTSEAHNGAYFLPWHRFFLFYLENYVRTTFDADFTLPYWDWSSFSDAPDPALSTVWNPEYIGGSDGTLPGTTTGRPIPDGPFRSLRAHYLDDHPIRRGFVSGRSGSIRAVINATVVEELIRRNDWTWGDFSDGVEAAHNVIHNDIGGDMFLTANSPNDPVFYLHHAFVDKIWWERQQLYNPNAFSGDHTFVDRNGFRTTRLVSSDFIFQYFELPVNVTFNQDCVTYQPYRPGTRSGGVLVTETSATSNIDDVCRDTDMMSEDRCLHGEEILEEAAAGV